MEHYAGAQMKQKSRSLMVRLEKRGSGRNYRPACEGQDLDAIPRRIVVTWMNGGNGSAHDAVATLSPSEDEFCSFLQGQSATLKLCSRISAA